MSEGFLTPKQDYPQTESRLSGKCSIILVFLDCNKCFCLRCQWTLDRGPPISLSLKGAHDCHPNLTQREGAGRGGTVILHSSGCIRLKIQISRTDLSHVSPSWRHPPRGYSPYSAGSQNPRPQTNILMKDKAPSSPLPFLTTSSLCRGEKLFY